MNKNFIIAGLSGLVAGSLALNIALVNKNAVLAQKVRLAELVEGSHKKTIERMANKMTLQQLMAVSNEMAEDIKFMDIMFKERLF